VAADGSFYDIPNRDNLPIRDRSDVPVSTLRKPEMLPPAEIRKAVTAIIQVNVGTSVQEVVAETARLLGFKTTSKQLRELIEREVSAMQFDGIIGERLGTLGIITG
jgi:hypothetical protein